MNHLELFLDKVATKTAIVGVIGLGYVGLPLVMRISEAGFKVLGFDIDSNKVDFLRTDRSYIGHISGDMIAQVRKRGFLPTTDFSLAKEADVLIICVPTPLNHHREPDLSFVISTMDGLLPWLRPGQLVSLESTTYPGTTEEELRPRIEKQGLRVGEDVFLVYSPEREDPGNPKFHTQVIPKVCGGCTPACLKAGMAIYGAVIDRMVSVSSTQGAEMVKLLENIHRAVNIGLVNEMKMIADRMGLDIFEIIDAAATKPFGFVPYYPGPGLGGHCIPIDPFYLTWKARAYGLNTRFIELAGETNSNMPLWVMGKVTDALNDHHKSLRGSRILILGVAYKKNVDDIRESPAMELMEMAQNKGAIIAYSDPYVAVLPTMREHSFDLASVELTPENIASFDLVLLVTNHDSFDYDTILRHAVLIVDTRGVYRGWHEKVIHA